MSDSQLLQLAIACFVGVIGLLAWMASGWSPT